MLSGALEYKLLMSAVKLKALLNAACKVVDNKYTHLSDWRLGWEGTGFTTIFTNGTSFKVLDQLENVTSDMEMS